MNIRKITDFPNIHQKTEEKGIFLASGAVDPCTGLIYALNCYWQPMCSRFC